MYTGEGSTSYVTLRPEESTDVTLVLTNGGGAAQFSLTVNTGDGDNATDFFEYSLTPSSVFLENDTSAEITIQITLSSNITEGSTVTFTVIAESAFSNDFITFFLVATNRPPPQFTENVRCTATKLILL